MPHRSQAKTLGAWATVVVQDVHLRYEDTTSIPGQTLSAGVTLGSFEAQSTDSHWSEGFLQLSAPVNYKLLDVKDIACYINVTGDVVFPANCPDSEFYGRMQSMVGKGKKPVEGLDGPMQYLIKPISCNAKVKLNRTRPLDTSMPKVEVKVAITTLPLILREQQYETATNVAEAFTRIHRGAAYRRFKPSGTPSAAGRWKFALDCVRHDIRERNRRYTWAYFKSRRLAKIEYISAYVVKETQLPVPESVTKVLERLEKELTFEDIRYFR
ncbi:hypothetical protein SARC_07924 [Sphaeroforma arctica JP610]|uniref:Chorein N-terminal domain-containing protein n=1 Tax=Sphaeroforma arctica JP610 TaxID=667725 RepID=A0A0L0FSB1_9EUKA|nr:hypothetical protein SARC_07924 [Sphaeroforma arctica JP610]KNC79687.1 hypothetical protein SARC_07924 [Sphaeroforma arctica JP610]|eukprot:XP_014153589.1 hypothetical protein SARC_07924 [Sphaeroforma arctica JP610]